jgi:hypothetical protein
VQLTLSGNINYAPPGGGDNVNLPLSVTGTYAAQSIGTLDVPSGSASGTTVAISFGSVASPLGVYLRNRVGTGINVKINSSTPTFRLVDGGVLVQAGAVDPASNPLSSVDLILVNVQTVGGQIDFAVWGD